MPMAFNYQVPYIQQQRKMSCWYTAMQMLDHWHLIKEVGKQSIDPEWVEMSVRVSENFQRIGRASRGARSQLLQSAPLGSPGEGHYLNKGVSRSEMIDLAASSGLELIEWEKTGQVLTDLYSQLSSYGPLLSAGNFFNGQPHAIVITGVLEANLPYPDYSSESADEWVLYSDPLHGPASRISLKDFNSCFFLINEPGVMMGKK